MGGSDLDNLKEQLSRGLEHQGIESIEHVSPLIESYLQEIERIKTRNPQQADARTEEVKELRKLIVIHNQILKLESRKNSNSQFQSSNLDELESSFHQGLANLDLTEFKQIQPRIDRCSREIVRFQAINRIDRAQEAEREMDTLKGLLELHLSLIHI
eukprot:TRINITY_DN5433_c0_g1_i1.p1 TRINITY_DN5433_c0_g1~~TRINITY_DN5433_c0_g1_i1.p1  ORF type:complete len:167 (-),score=29.50 TRINITY_DN5433_c0_g1_i1:12-482(-)